MSFKKISMLLLLFSVNRVTGQCKHVSGYCEAGCWNENNTVVIGLGIRICVPVGIGYYSPNGSNERKPCPAGRASGETDMASTCFSCLPGSYSELAASSCTTCPRSTYQNLPRQSTCRSCSTENYNGTGANDFTYDRVTLTIFCELFGIAPSAVPSRTPSALPTSHPSISPSSAPSPSPSTTPSTAPSSEPSSPPSSKPSQAPSKLFSAAPSNQASSLPTLDQSSNPSYRVSDHPSMIPSRADAMSPSLSPSMARSSNRPIPTLVKLITAAACLLTLLVIGILVVHCCCCCRRRAIINTLEEDIHQVRKNECDKYDKQQPVAYAVADVVILDAEPVEAQVMGMVV